MKKLAVKKTHEKVILAAIILSCGLVMQADPPARQHQKQAQLTENWHKVNGQGNAYAAKQAKHPRQQHLHEPLR